jgi:STE24 endopeptidase
MSFLSLLFFLGLLLMLCLQVYLANRQIKLIKLKQDIVPDRFLNILTVPQHKKNSEYNIAKLNLSILKAISHGLLVLIMTFGSGINWFNVFIDKILGISSLYWHDIAIISLYMIFNSLLSVAFSLYSTFEIEQKYGFNKMTLKMFFSDLIKATLISIVIGLPLMLIALFLIYHLPYSWWLLVFILLLVFNLLMLVLYPLLIAPIFNKFSPLSNEELKQEIQNLIDKAGLYFNGIFIMDASKRSTHGNAYFTGIGKSKRIVFFDSLLNKLSNNEIIAVLAHELGHFKYKHIIKQISISLMLMFITFYLINFEFYNAYIYHSLGVINVNAANGILIAMIILEVISFFISPLFSRLSRSNEFQADAFAEEIANKNDLITGLIKLSCENAAVLYPDSLYVAVYYSHPTLSERIRALE